MTRKKEQTRLRQLVAEALRTLCEASISYQDQFKIHGTIGIHVDDEDFSLTVNLDESVLKPSDNPSSAYAQGSKRSSNDEDVSDVRPKRAKGLGTVMSLIDTESSESRDEDWSTIQIENVHGNSTQMKLHAVKQEDVSGLACNVLPSDEEKKNDVLHNAVDDENDFDDNDTNNDTDIADSGEMSAPAIHIEPIPGVSWDQPMPGTSQGQGMPSMTPSSISQEHLDRSPCPTPHDPDLHTPDLHTPDLHGPYLHTPDLHMPNLHGPHLHCPAHGDPDKELKDLDIKDNLPSQVNEAFIERCSKMDNPKISNLNLPATQSPTVSTSDTPLELNFENGDGILPIKTDDDQPEIPIVCVSDGDDTQDSEEADATKRVGNKGRNKKGPRPLPYSEEELRRVAQRYEYDTTNRIKRHELKSKLLAEEIQPTEAELASYRANRMHNRAKEKERRRIEKLAWQKLEKIRFLEVESALCAMDHEIKKSLQKDHPNIQTALQVMDDLKRLCVSALLLRRNTGVFTTLKKCRKYKDENIRKKADIVYNRFKSYLWVRKGETFQQMLERESDYYKRLTHQREVAGISELDGLGCDLGHGHPGHHQPAADVEDEEPLAPDAPLSTEDVIAGICADAPTFEQFLQQSKGRRIPIETNYLKCFAMFKK